MFNNTMQAVRIHDYRMPHALRFEDIPIPTPSDNEILVRVQAAGVLPVDVAFLEGFFRGIRPTSFPLIPGSAYAGIVVECGRNVTEFHQGQAVFGRSPNGAFADYITIPIGTIPERPYHLSAAIPKPTPISIEQSATLSGGANTAWRVLFDAANIQAGQNVLIQGAAGGVGAFAVQLARWKGANVFGTTSTPNIEFVRTMGADTVIDYTSTRFEDMVTDVDVVIDTVGGDTLTRSFGVVRRGGVLYSIVEEPDQTLAAQYGVHAPFFNTPPSPDHFVTIFQTLAELIEEGEISVPLPRLFSWHDVQEAYRVCKTGHGRGRIVLQIDS